jgi:hypothetical protein
MIKRGLLLVVAFLVVSCAKNIVEKPGNLISEKKMEAILFDLALLNASKNVAIKELKDYNLMPRTYLFEKYSIDSLQFAESMKYYASKPNKNIELYETVEKKLQKIKDSLEAIISKDLEDKQPNKLRERDSLIKPKSTKE